MPPSAVTGKSDGSGSLGWRGKGLGAGDMWVWISSGSNHTIFVLKKC